MVPLEPFCALRRVTVYTPEDCDASGYSVLTAAMEGPPGEVRVDVELVEVLLAQQHPNLATLPVRAGESGFDNFMFRLGESFAVRLPRTAAAARLLVNEQRWLLTLSDRLPLQIPVPIRVGQPAFGFPWRWSVVPWLVGATAEISPVAALEALRLASFLRALHVAAPADAPRNFERTATLTSRAGAIGERMRHLERTTDVINDGIRRAWSEGLNAPNDTPPTWIHGDLHARNVLTLDGTITGVIDWGDMTSGDPAIDLACLWMLLPSEEARTQAQRAYDVDDAALWARARGWAVLFGVTLLDTGLTGNSRNAVMGEQILRRI